MASIRFYLKNKDLNNESLIMAKIHFDNKNFFLSVGTKILPEQWNFDDQRAKSLKGNRSASDLNVYLDGLTHIVNKVHLEFKNSFIKPSVSQFKARVVNKLQYGSSVTFSDFFERFIEERKGIVSKNTLKKYVTTLNHFKEYCKIKNRNVDFEDIDMDFYYAFVEYFYSDKLKSSANTAGKSISIFKVVLNSATERGYNKNLTFRSSAFKTPSQETDKIYLNKSELKIIYEFDFSHSKKLDRIRDMFIIGCYTGLRFSDFITLNLSSVRTVSDSKGNEIEIIFLRTVKTNTPVAMPFHPYVKSVFDKYTTNGILQLPRVISNQKMNDYLKEMAREADIVRSIEIVQSIAGKPKKQTFQKCELVTSHTCRRSFASNAFISGIPVESIMKITGHRTSSSFMKYIRISVEENALLMAANAFFKI
jgi:site-specific recombinase XerD